MTSRAAPGPVRVVHLAQFAAPYPGSFVPMVAAIGEAVQARGWRFELLVPEAARERAWFAELPALGVDASLVPRMSRRRLAAWLRRRLDAEEPAVLHTHFAGYDAAAAAAALGRPRWAVVWHVHNRLRPEPAVRARNTLTYGVLGRRVSRLLCVAPDTVDDARARLAPRDRTVFFPNAVDTERLAPPGPEERARVRAELGLAAGSAVLVHFGWDWAVKGGPLFVEVVRELRDRGRDVVGLTIGAGAEARAAIAAAGLGPGLRAVEPHPDVRRWHAAADVVVSSSGAEGMPFALIEALSAGVPAVASHVTAGQVAIATDLRAYRLVDLDARAFATAVEELLDRPPEQARADAVAARAAMRERFDLQPWAQRVLALYDQILRGRAG
jgi:glycosyltransferase involved in cell wall biosynthesis